MMSYAPAEAGVVMLIKAVPAEVLPFFNVNEDPVAVHV